MRKWFLLLWLLAPVGLLTWHYGPGQERLALDRAQRALEAITELEKQGEWQQALEAYDQVIALAPDTEERQLIIDHVRFGKASARLELGEWQEGVADLRQLIQDASERYGPASPILRSARDRLGRAHYEAMLTLRLQNEKRDVWMQQAELARQHFRFLAEHPPVDDERGHRVDRLNLEATLRTMQEVKVQPAAAAKAAARPVNIGQPAPAPPPPPTSDTDIRKQLGVDNPEKANIGS